MTQFALFVGPLLDPAPPPHLRSAPLADGQPFLRRAAEFLFPAEELRECWHVDVDDEATTDDLCTEAQRELAGGAPLAATRLGQLLTAACGTCPTFALWYGSEWENLPVVSGLDDAPVVIESSLAQGQAGEVYLRFVGGERWTAVVRTGTFEYGGISYRVRIVRRSYDPDDDGHLDAAPFLNADGEQFGVEWESPASKGRLYNGGWMALSLEEIVRKAESVMPITWDSPPTASRS